MNVKSEKFRRFILQMRLLLFLPLHLLWSCVVFIVAFRLKPYPTAFEKFGIRVVALGDNEDWNNQKIKVFVALELLNRHDKEKFELVKKYIRIIFLSPMDPPTCRYWGDGVCILGNIQKIPAEKRVVTVIGWLVYEASRVKFVGKRVGYLRTSEEVKNLCKEEHRRTMQKFCE